MKRGLLVAWTALLATGACTGFGPADGSSIAGQYELAAVDGNALPCCGQTDSAGTRATIVGGSLTLGEAAPEKFVATPGGMVAESCVHEVPNGAHIDTAGVVTLPDSSQYKIPQCGDGSYTMIITRMYEDVDGATRTKSDTAAGKYVWSDSDQATITLLGIGLGGPITRSSESVELTVSGRYGLPPLGSTGPGPRYEFASATN